MTTTEKQKLIPFEGKVITKSHKDGKPTGLKLDTDREHWFNYTQPDWREDWYEPSEGDSVRLHVGGGKWIKSIELMESEKAPWDPAPSEHEKGQRRGNALNVAGAVVAAFIAHGHYDNEEYPVDAAFIDVLAHAQDLERGEEPKELPFA